MSGKKAGTKPPLGHRVEELVQRFRWLKGRMDGQDASINGLIERIKQEFKSSVESLKTLIIRAELSSASSEMISRALRNCQTEVDSLFYLLNLSDPERFSMENLREMTLRVQHAQTCGPAVDAACGLFAIIVSPTASIRLASEPQEEESVESGDSGQPGAEQIPAQQAAG